MVLTLKGEALEVTNNKKRGLLLSRSSHVDEFEEHLIRNEVEKFLNVLTEFLYFIGCESSLVPKVKG